MIPLSLQIKLQQKEASCKVLFSSHLLQQTNSPWGMWRGKLVHEGKGLN